jgi:GYF domain 2
MAEQWTFEGWVYHDTEGMQVGPVPTARLRQLMARGEVQPADRVWRQWGGVGQLLVPTLAQDALRDDQSAGPFSRAGSVSDATPQFTSPC